MTAAPDPDVARAHRKRRERLAALNNDVERILLRVDDYAEAWARVHAMAAELDRDRQRLDAAPDGT